MAVLPQTMQFVSEVLTVFMNRPPPSAAAALFTMVQFVAVIVDW